MWCNGGLTVNASIGPAPHAWQTWLPPPILRIFLPRLSYLVRLFPTRAHQWKEWLDHEMLALDKWLITFDAVDGALGYPGRKKHATTTFFDPLRSIVIDEH